MLTALLAVASIGRADDRLLATAEQAAPLLGRWRGTAAVGTQSSELGLEFAATQHGVLLRTTLPPLRAWGMPTGFVVAEKDGSWSLPDWHITLVRTGDTLSGQLGDPRVTFTARKTTELPQASATAAFPTGPALRWQYDAGAPLWASVVAADGVAYAGDTRGRLHAVEVRTGRANWVAELGAPLYGAALIEGPSVFVNDDAAQLHRIDRATGKERWRSALGIADEKARQLPEETVFDFDYQGASPIAHQGVLYVTSSAGLVHAVDPENGRVLWRQSVGAKVRTNGAVSADKVFVSSNDNFVHALDRTTGRPLWKFDTGGPATSSPVVFGDLVLAGSRSSWLTALRANTGAPVWARFHWFSWVEATGVIDGGLYYVGSSDLRAVRALDPASGESRWETDVLGWAWGPLALDGDTVYVGTAGAREYITGHEGGVMALDRATGAIRWRRSAPKPANAFVSGYPGSVTLHSDILLAPNVNGVLEAYTIR